MPRLRLYDIRTSRFPEVIGSCMADTAAICRYVNTAQQRLMFCKEAGEEGWYGTWAEVVFNVSRTSPYLTLPREIARLEAVNICQRPVAVYNQFYEYLQWGSGKLPKIFRQCNPNCLTEGMQRNNVPTFIDLSNTPQYLRAYISNDADVVGRIFYNGWDQNSKQIYTQDGTDQVTGVFNQLASPFVTTAQQFTRLSGIQKDRTFGPVEIFQVDPDTGDEVLLLTMQPGETSANYRRYYFNNLPLSCCPPTSEAQPLQLTAICKLEPIPVTTDTDYLVIQNLEALIEEAQSIRYSEMDTIAAKQMSSDRHQQAVNYLNGELTHYYGKQEPSIEVKPYGSADLRKQRIGTML